MTVSFVAWFLSLENVIVNVLGRPPTHSVATTTHISPRPGVVELSSFVTEALKLLLSSRFAVKFTSVAKMAAFLAAMLMSKDSMLGWESPVDKLRCRAPG